MSESESESVTLWLTVSHILVSSPLCGYLTRCCFLFKCLGLKFVVLSLWGALSDERPGLSFVSHSLVICLCVVTYVWSGPTGQACQLTASQRLADGLES
jgi:hypothetical protein